MKTYLTLFFSILVLSLFGQKKSFTINQPFFQIEEEINGKYYANSIIEGKLDTIMVYNEVKMPKYTSEIVDYPEITNLTKIKIDTIYKPSKNCKDNIITTINHYTLTAGINRKKQVVSLRGDIQKPAVISYQIFEQKGSYVRKVEVFSAIHSTKYKAVLAHTICPRILYKFDTTQIEIPNNNCNQYYEITLHNYYSGEEAWSENIIIIDESTRQYEKEIIYRQENKLQKVEVLFPETTLIKTIQRKLKKDNYYKGKITGKLDFETQTAILNYQKENGLPQGQLDLKTLEFMSIL